MNLLHIIGLECCEPEMDSSSEAGLWKIVPGYNPKQMSMEAVRGFEAGASERMKGLLPVLQYRRPPKR